MKDKILYILIGLSFIFLTGCASQPKKITIGVSQCSEDAWRTLLNQEMQREASMYDNIELIILAANDNSEKQNADIRYFIDRKVDLIVVTPNEAAPVTAAVEEAMNAGIPVIMTDRKILSQKYTAYIGADNYQIGQEVGLYLANTLKGEGCIVELTGLGGSTPAMERTLGFADAIAAYPDLHLISVNDAAWNHADARVIMDSLLAIYPRIDAVYAQNDRMALGAYEAAFEKKRHKEMVFTGIDALPGKNNGIDLVSNHVLNATFIYPTQGDKIIQTALRILLGEPFDKETVLQTAAIGPENAHIMQLQNQHINSLDEKITYLKKRLDNYLIHYDKQQIILYGSCTVLMIVILLLIVTFRALRSKGRLNRELSLQKEQLEAQRDQLEQQRDQLIELSEQLHDATNAKMVFFTNISHDIRTPLTLIADPIEQLLKQPGVNGRQEELLNLMKRNTGILLRLVNQILDFRKYENGKMDFHPQLLDLAVRTGEWVKNFGEALAKKEIAFSFNIEEGGNYLINADPEKIERIVFNLLSNAIKFTPEKGSIQIAMTTSHDGEVGLKIINSGNNVPLEEIRNIFERFYTTGTQHAGTGIGLALTKAFVELHGGKIEAVSDPENGTCMMLHFPQATGVTENQDSLPEIPPPTVFLPEEDSAAPDFMLKQELNKTTVLIIDDNQDIRTYLHTLLSTEYRIIHASTGSEGIRKAVKYVPDLIIADVMMPGMDGLECCEALKSQIQTCHIPVILLTACTLEEQRISGYARGADSYISKPFNSSLLITRIKNLIESRKQLQQRFTEQPEVIQAGGSDMDHEFIGRFRSLIQERMGDSDLNIDVLVKEMGMSRVQLYRKVKSLTDYSPNEMIRMLRLKKAATLLTSSDMTVAEVCYRVGFNSPSYFTKCYKEFHGKNPGEIIRNRHSIHPIK